MLSLGLNMAASSVIQSAAPKLLDTSGDAAAAYSLRLLNSSYGGNAVNVRRDNDNAEAEIGFAGGELDTKALSDHCGSANGFVDTWFDQSGNGNDAVQETTGSQPKIYDGTTGVVMDGGRVALTSSNDKSFDFTQISDINSVFSVLRPTNFTSSSTSYILGDGSNYDYHAGNSGKWLDSVHADAVVKNGDNYLNGTSVNLTTLTRSAGQYVLSMIHTANTAVASRISKDRHLDRSWVGNLQELIIYTDDKSIARPDIESDMNDFYSIY